MSKINENRKPSFYRGILQDIEQPIFSLSEEMEISFSNREFTELTNIISDEITGQKFVEVFPDMKDTEFYDACHKVLKTGEPGEIEVWFNRIYLQMNIFPSEEGIVCLAEDITEERVTGMEIMRDKKRFQEELKEKKLHPKKRIEDYNKIEEVLQESSTSFADFLKNALIGFYRTTPDGEILLANPALIDMLGFDSFEELKEIDLEADEFNAGYNRKEFKKKMEEEGEIEGFESVWQRKDGTLAFLRESARAVYDEEGNIKFYEGTIEDITREKSYEQQIKSSYKDLENAIEATIKTMAKVVEIKDPYTAGHQERVAQLAVEIAKKMELDAEQIRALRMAGLIHDIGKISIPSEILSKPTPLNSTEYRIIQRHPQVGYDILKSVNFPWPLAQIVHQHHETLDGEGYPQGIKGEEIVIESRILTVADIVESMASHRPYRPAKGLEIALGEVKEGRGTKYDKKAVDNCEHLFKEEGFELRDVSTYRDVVSH